MARVIRGSSWFSHLSSSGAGHVVLLTNFSSYIKKEEEMAMERT